MDESLNFDPTSRSNVGQPELDAMAADSIAKIRYSHEDMIDCLLSNPHITQNELALRYGYTPSWVSTVMSSDAWKAQYAKRRSEMVDPTVALSVNERMEALAQRSLDVLMTKLDEPAVPASVALKALELGARGREIGGFARPIAPPSPDGAAFLAGLASASELYSKVRGQSKPLQLVPSVVDAEILEPK